MKIKTKKRTQLSADIPLELQDEIIKRLPVKALLRFRSVSKRWRALIDSSEFIADHNVNQTQPHHLLIVHCESLHGRYSKDEFVYIVDDDSFRHHKFYPTVKPSIAWYSRNWSDSCTVIVGWSHGLVCLYNSDWYRSKIVIWNPSIRKFVRINYLGSIDGLGFGVCPKTFDVKIVKIKRRSAGHYGAEVFTLKLGAWRSISMNLPHKPQKFPNYAVVIDGVIHWLVTKNSRKSFDHWIVSFDLKTEEFREVYLPDSLANSQDLGISKCKNSLVILDYDSYGVCDVWMMFENGVSSFSFIKLFTVNATRFSIIGFSKNGQVILEDQDIDDGCSPRELKAYNPDLKHMKDLGIDTGLVIDMASYTESLLLLNHSTSA